MRNDEKIAERTKKIAVPLQEEKKETVIEVIIFVLGTETYALEVSFVREVAMLASFTEVFGVPNFIQGITNLRGEIVSLVNLKKFLALPEIGIKDRPKIIIVDNEKIKTGLIVDDVLQIESFLQSQLTGTKQYSEIFEGHYIKGIFPNNIILLDTEKFLDDKRMTIND